MKNIFDYDNPVWRVIGQLVDLCFITVLWAICSIPIITIGASTTAAYYTILKMVSHQEKYTISSFFDSWKKNFAESTKAWMLLLTVGVILVSDLVLFYNNPSPLFDILFWFLMIVSVVLVMVATWTFPVIARCADSFKEQLKMAFYLAIHYFSWTILMIVVTVCVLAISIFVYWPLLFLSIGGIIYVHALIINQVFNRNGLKIED
ncbi:putative membrane protein YesL [Lachnotalea glycerini]|uniref:DUF624 domain-containing protein n=1 Tax=Lachnotalea glycerini TaxID=1763509 RepID=A0A255ICB1_9FIRM|nr:DUF624 domain-containing protein [Lachnotalea glycerini]OYP08761.1 hypothetical protein CG709_09525 [Lachnotalea glycerini]PXV85053.1 putative membrane protein YesL [Lachnotalea glycerini]RDY28642.1 DUF624 domain-containing protein [Lachnotalea glycerini]